MPQNALAWFIRHSHDYREEATVGDAGIAADELRVFLISSTSDTGASETELELQARDAPAPSSINGSDELWVPAEVVPVGSELRVQRRDVCTQQTRSSIIGVGEPLKVPGTLGTIDVEVHFGPLELETSSGSCTLPVNSQYADVVVDLNPDARPYKDILRYSLLVDGVPYRNTDWNYDASDDNSGFGGHSSIAGSTLGAGTERAFAVCQTYRDDDVGEGEGVGEGEHELQMVALLPDGTALKSNVVRVDLTCPASDGLDAGPTDGSAQNHSDSHVESDSADASNDVESSKADAAVESDHNDDSDGGSELPKPRVQARTEGRKSGCSMTVSNDSAAPVAAVTVAALWLAVALRRPRSSRPRPRARIK